MRKVILMLAENWYNTCKESKEYKDMAVREMELAKISSKGQITIPLEIRKKLGLKEGDKVLFLDEGEKIIITNASLMAFKEIQETRKMRA